MREQAAAEVDRRGAGDEHAAVLKPKPRGSGGGPEHAPTAPAKPDNAAAVDERAAPEAEGGEREGGAVLD